MKMNIISSPLTRASIFILTSISFVYITYSAFFSGEFHWKISSSASHVAAAVEELPTNISHIVFGLGGSAKTWYHRCGYSELWWRPGATRGYVWLDEEPSQQCPSASPPYKVCQGNFSKYGARAAAARMAMIVAELASAEREDVRWYVMGDDDTVFFVENLAAVLGKYDHREMWYIGAPSESVEQDQLHSFDMAFGGGGFALSFPAATALGDHLEGCLERYATLYGSDQRVHACLIEMGVPLTVEPGFHQVDLRGDAYGMLAAHAVAPLVSLHHLDNLRPIFPYSPSQLSALRSLVAAGDIDQPRILQQTFCYERRLNWSLSISWGYTAQLYPFSVHPRDLAVAFQTFKTWRSFKDGPFTFRTRPMLPGGACKRPLIYFLDRVEEMKGKRGELSEETVSVYVKNDTAKISGCGSAAGNVKKVIVFARKSDSNRWRKAPRRECCDLRRNKKGSSIQARIRHCNSREITPPP